MAPRVVMREGCKADQRPFSDEQDVAEVGALTWSPVQPVLRLETRETSCWMILSDRYSYFTRTGRCEESGVLWYDSAITAISLLLTRISERLMAVMAELYQRTFTRHRS